VRQGLRALLAGEPDIEVVGEAADGIAAVEMAERFKPDVLIVDVLMPGLIGLESVRQVGQRAPKTRCIVLSMHANDAYVLEALRNGAAGYVLKGSDASELLLAVRTVAGGNKFLSPDISAASVEDLLRRAEETRVEDAYETLTNREREVFQLAAEGMTNGGIAERLFISARTVEIHRANVLRKLGMRTQTDLVRYAVRRGLISAD
jgi:DNA-binding NarL/FixJ family response regulator